MMLADVDIRKALKEKDLQIKPFRQTQLGSSGYDLRLHQNFRVFHKNDISHIDVAQKQDLTRLVKAKPKGSFVIRPGQFVLASTLEVVTLGPAIAAILEGRSSLGRLGLIVHATASHIPPGFRGHITFEMTNLTNLPIKLYVGMRVAQLVFVRMSSPVRVMYGQQAGSKYQDQEPPTASKIWEDFRE